MKKFYSFCALLLLSSSAFSQSYSVCAGSTLILTAPSASTLANPSYSVDPGGVTSSSPNFTVQPNVTTVYTLYTTGTTSNSALVTSTSTATVHVGGYATSSLSSSGGDYTLGCSSKSIITITAFSVSSIPPSSGFTFTYLPPGSSNVLPSGSLSANNTMTLNIAGTWTLVIRNHPWECSSRIGFTVLMNTIAPQIDTLIVPTTVLNCTITQQLLMGQTIHSNSSFQWKFNTAPFTQNGSNINVSVAANPTQTLVDTYTLELTDNSNLCKSIQMVSIYQNRFPPNAKIGTGIGTQTILSCLNPSVALSNMSSSQAPVVFPGPLPIVSSWQGPPPQVTQSFVTTYAAYYPGTYTMTAMDLNNGCTSQATIAVFGVACVGFSEYSGDPDIEIYPNPTQEMVTVRWLGQEKMVYKLFDASGRLLCTDMLKPDKSIDLSGFERGVYFLRISDGSSVTPLKKLVRE